MDTTIEYRPAIDVICQHKADQTLIPLKIRLCDEDGEFQTFSIKSYKLLSSPGVHKLPNGITSTSHTWQFACKINCFGVEKSIRLFYNAYDNYWKIDYN